MGKVSQRADKAVRRVLSCRVNVQVFWAFICLFCAALAASAFLSMLITVGFTYSTADFARSDNEIVSYVYQIDGVKYVYNVPHTVPLAIVNITENVYYIKSKPEIRVGIADVAVYPVLLAFFGAAFSLLMNKAQLNFDENSETLRSYKTQAIISMASVIPCCTCMFFAATFYISAYINRTELTRSIRSTYLLFMLMGANAVMWAITLLLRSRKKKKNS